MGRGKYHRSNRRISTQSLLCIRLADLKKHKCLIPGQSFIWQWSSDGQKVASVGCTIAASFIRFEYTVEVDRDNFTIKKMIPLILTPCNFGGHRKWFLCGCGRKAATIFICGHTIACRSCFNAVYPSQREDALVRQQCKLDKLSAKLKDNLCRPKGMHMKTFAQIKNELIRTFIEKDKLFESEFSRRFPRGLE